MENASKALIIAGAILLALLIIGLGVFIYNQASNTVNSTTNLDSLEVAKFNEQFEPYLNKEISGTTAKSLIRTIEMSNYTNDVQIDCAGASEGDVKRARTYTTEVIYVNGVITKIYLKDAEDGTIVGDIYDDDDDETQDDITTATGFNACFIGFLRNNLKPGEARKLINRINERNEEILKSGYGSTLPQVIYTGPSPIADARTYTAEAVYNKEGFIVEIIVTMNSTNNSIDEDDITTVRGFNADFEDFIGRSLRPGEVRNLISRITERNQNIINNGYSSTLQTITYSGPSEIEDANTYIAEAVYNGDGYIISIIVTMNGNSDDGEVVIKKR